MGNRAVISFQNCGAVNGDEEKLDKSAVGLYLHWNGGLESIEAFCKAATDLEIKDSARFIQMVGNWFGGNQSVYVDTVGQLDCDNFDNGTYVVKRSEHEWKIFSRFFVPDGTLDFRVADHDERVAEMSHDVFTKSVIHFMKGETNA